MTKNELSNTFLNGTVITAKYDDGHYIVDFQDTDDEVSRIGEFESFDEMIHGLIPTLKENVEEIEEVNTLAVKLHYAFEEQHHYSMIELIEKLIEEVKSPSPFTIVDEDTGDTYEYRFIDDDSANSFNYIDDNARNAIYEITCLADYLQNNDYFKDNILTEELEPLPKQLEELCDKLQAIYGSIVNVYRRKGLFKVVKC